MKLKKYISYGDKIIEYNLSRKKKNGVRLSVKSDGVLWVSAGKITPNKFIDDFILQNADFLLNEQEKKLSSNFNINSRSSLNEGDIYRLWGEEYKILMRNSPENKIIKDEKEKILTFSCEYVENYDKKRALMDKFEREECKIVFENLSEKVYNTITELNMAKAEIRLRKMKSCWGVCHFKSGYITMNTKLVYYPVLASEYIMHHEYAHFVHGNHSKDFYKLVEKYLPDWKERRALLKD